MDPIIIYWNKAKDYRDFRKERSTFLSFWDIFCTASRETVASPPCQRIASSIPLEWPPWSKFYDHGRFLSEPTFTI